jgi:site-specific DNA recombinase
LLIDRIRKAGGRFFSVRDGLDTGTDAGRLVAKIMLDVAEFDLDGIRSDWMNARERAIRRGICTGAWIPPGYRKSRSGRLRPDPRTAPTIAEVFRRRATGESLARLCRYLEHQGVRTGKGYPGWHCESLYRLLARRVYVGELSLLDVVCEHAHPGIVDEATWAAAQSPRQLQRRTEVEPALLAGLLRCAHCSRPVGSARRPGEGRYYACRMRFTSGCCPSPAYATGRTLEPYVVDAFFRLLARRRRPPTRSLGRAEAQFALAQARLVSYRDNERLRELLASETFEAGLIVRNERMRDAAVTVSDLRARVANHELPSVADLRASWDGLDIYEQRALLARVIDCVFLAQGRLRIERRVTICPRGTGPKGLSCVGGKPVPLRQIMPRRDWINPAA